LGRLQPDFLIIEYHAKPKPLHPSTPMQAAVAIGIDRDSAD